MKSSMDRLRYDKGFTMVEMVVVLLLVCLCMVIFPLSHIHTEAAFQMQMEILRKELLSLQMRAIHEKKHIEVDFIGEALRSEDKVINLHMRCRGRLSFNASGNVNRAMSIPCTLDGETKKLIIQLGSGRMYVE